MVKLESNHDESSRHFKRFTVATMTLLTMWNICRRWPRICSVCRSQSHPSFLFLVCHRIFNKMARCLPPSE